MQDHTQRRRVGHPLAKQTQEKIRTLKKPRVRHPAPTSEGGRYKTGCKTRLGEILGEDYVGGVPDGGGDGAAGLSGDDDLERFGVGGEVG